MTEAERKLEALWNADAPPARDALFRLAVQERLVRRRLQVKAALLGLALIGALALTAAGLRDLNALNYQQAQPLAFLFGACALAWSAYEAARRLRR